MNKIRNEKKPNPKHHRNKKNHKKLYEKLHANKMDNLEEVDKFLERYNLLRLNQEEIENMNSSVTSTEIEIVIKIFQQTKFQDQMASKMNYIKH